ncbi:DUF6773 family protein [Paradesulfitobacterium ferrireducens]|uniref:DUF6773 family protein n=1 Tax=Paradesulfitobacterium ferrireducens TaxID=2816476 RepID=UPI001A8FC868|nr:DUF6773 family protein [Paradesulfitobacterium ferrireducens]
MKDERIEQAKNKIRSEIAIIILYGVAISILVKTLVFKMGIQQCITEYFIVIFFPLYQFIRMHMMKVSIYRERGNKQMLKGLIITIVVFIIVSAVSLFNSMKNPTTYHWQSTVFLIAYLVLFITISFFVHKFNQYRGHKYEKEFDDDK